MDIHLTSGAMGFGDQICTLSLLANIPDPVTLHCNDVDNTYQSLKGISRLLNIPEDNVDIVFKPNQGRFAGGYNLSVAGQYYKPKQVNVFGKNIDVVDHSRSKPYIGFACYNGLDIYLDRQFDQIRASTINEGNFGDRVPQCRYRNLIEYTRLMRTVRSWGWDIITLDHPGNLDLKVLNLLENCTAVIGYEGGIAHLCHCLKIPYLMFDYRKPNSSAIYGDFQIEVTHQSEYLYVMRDPKELLYYDKIQFSKLVENLKYGSGNNRIVNGSVTMRFQKGANSRIDFLDPDGNVVYQSLEGPAMTSEAARFIEIYFPNKFKK